VACGLWASASAASERTVQIGKANAGELIFDTDTDGGGWFRLVEGPPGVALEPVELLSYDGVVSAKRSTSWRPLLVIRGHPKLRSGPVVTATDIRTRRAGRRSGAWFGGPPMLERTGDSLSGQFAGQFFVLKLKAGRESNALVLQVNGQKQRLFETSAGDPLPPDDDNAYKQQGPIELDWAGDLDGDGKLDLLLTEWGLGKMQILFLSSDARGGALVGEAAVLSWGSC
jgi:hypothetical protein